MKIQIPFVSAAFLASLILSVGCSLQNFSASRDYQKTIPVNSQVEVVVDSFNGDILVTKSDTPEIAIVAHMKAYGSSQEAAESALDALVPSIDSYGQSIQIKAKQTRRVGFMSDSVDFELRIPAGCELRLTTSNGKISSEDSQASITANSSNGSISVTKAKGVVDLNTSNGPVELNQCEGIVGIKTSNGRITLVDCLLEGNCKATTSNGKIEVSLPRSVNLSISASTSNGSIEYPEDLLNTAKKSKQAIEGTWGEATDTNAKKDIALVLETSNGQVLIEESKPSPSL